MSEMRSLFNEPAQRKSESPAQIFTISQLNQVVRDLLEAGLPALWVEGEISNFIHHRNGHMYFRLKDEVAEIDAVMFSDQNTFLQFRPGDGQKIIAFGQVTLYERRGRYQINVYEMRPAGIGKLQLEFERLKARLQAEGLFDARFKQPIPKFPERIGIITSPEGAALLDVLKILRERYPAVEVLIFPAKVQGEGAAHEIASAIRQANSYHRVADKIDTLIVTRGGGSLEDLWAFNEESVARAIFESSLPIISAIGHEIDVTIADLVADLRAPTPTAAGQLAVPDRAELLNIAQNSLTRLHEQVTSHIEDRSLRLQMLQRSPGLHRPAQLLREHQQTLDHSGELLAISMRQQLLRLRERWRGLLGRIESLNPAAVLRRGFSIVENEQRQIVYSVEQVVVGECLWVKLHRGRLVSRVEAKEAGDGEEIPKD